MIRFDPQVRIHHFDDALMPVLLNFSMWSNKHHTAGVVALIQDSGWPAQRPTGMLLQCDLQLEKDDPPQLESLYQYMRATMPEGFDVLAGKGVVHVARSMKRGEHRL